MCDDYLILFHKTDLQKILMDADTSKHYSIDINFIELYEHQPNLVVELFKEPEKCLEEWDKSTLKAQMVLLKDEYAKCELKNNVHCRIYHLPFWPAVRRTVFPGNDEAGKFFEVSGTVMRVTAAKVLKYQRSYICVKCKTPVLVKAEYDRRYMITQPKKCANPDGCGGTNLVNLNELDSENCKDYQEIKIQEQVKQLGVRAIPNTMLVTLEDDLVESCQPGDNVTICGVLIRRWGEFRVGRRIDIDLAFKANHVQVDNTSSITTFTPEVKAMFNTFWEKYSVNALEGRDVILRSFCPQLYGLYLVKLAVAVVLAGGSQLEDITDITGTGVSTRTEPHLLLVGDPGTGKSQLLRFASKIIPRSIMTTGVGSTAAGLTVSAIMEHGEWQLEGGALVMADGGICCIDEFNTMKQHDRTSIHEAMEQQTISVAKASMVCKLKTRCSILAACNPKGNIDPSQPLCMNIALPSPLLSRFDLILLLRDTVNEGWDRKVANYILNEANNFSKLTDTGLWTIDILQSYFVMIKKLHPKLTDDAKEILSAYYQMQRSVDSRNKSRTTVRLLESLVRLSQGHARLMYHEKVQIIDSVYAIILVDTAMGRDASILNLNIHTNSIFPERPANDYREMLESVLNKLHLQEILEKEINALNRIRDNRVHSRFFDVPNGRGGNENDAGEMVQLYLPETKNRKPLQEVNDNGIAATQSERKTTENTQCDEKVTLQNDLKGSKKNETGNSAADIRVHSRSSVHTNYLKHRSTGILEAVAGSSKMKESSLIIDFFENGPDCEKAGPSAAENEPENAPSTDVFDADFEKCNLKSMTRICADASSITEPSSSKMKEANDETNLERELNYFSINDDKESSLNRELDNNKEPSHSLSSLSTVKEQVLETSVNKSSLKNKLNKFKFVHKNSTDQKPQEATTSASNQKENELRGKKINYLLIANDASENVSSGQPDSGQSSTKQSPEPKKKKTEFFVNEDLDMLRLMPGVNDDFNVDLDFDWDNFPQNVNNWTLGSSACGKNDVADKSSKEKLVLVEANKDFKGLSQNLESSKTSSGEVNFSSDSANNRNSFETTDSTFRTRRMFQSSDDFDDIVI